MFRELHAVARHTPMTLIVTPHGDQLRVIVIPKPGDDAPKDSALHKPLSFLGTPEELDTFSAEAIAQIGAYAAGTNALREKLDLPTDAVAAEAAETPKFPARSSNTTPKSKGGQAAAKRAAKKKAKAAPKPAAKPPAAKRERSRTPRQAAALAAGERQRAERDASADQRSGGPDTPARSAVGQSASQPVHATGQGEPGSHQRPADSPAPSERPATGKPPRHPDLLPRQPKIDRASKEQCLEDGKAYLIAIGAAKPSRELFVRWALTGRRYEKLWDNFAAFLAEVRGETSNTDQREPAAQELPAKASTEDAAHREGTAHSQGKPDEPAPGASRPTAAASETNAQQLVQSGSLPTRLPINAKWPFPRAREEDGQALAPKQEPQRHIRTIVTDTGTVLTSTAKAYDIGDKYTHAEFGDYRVISVEPARYVVTSWTDDAPTDKPTNNGDLLEGLASTQGA